MTKILVVDDNEQNRYILKLLLEGQRYDVVPVQNGIEALEAARTNPPDLIISDILMPGMDGFSLCRQWKTDEQLRGIPFIFYTATYTDPKDEDFALSLGAERFVRKPAEVDVFIRIVKEVLDQFKKKKPEFPSSPITEEKVFFKKYNEALIRKMEDKMLELEQANKRLSALFQTSVDLTTSIPQDELLAYILEKVIGAVGCDHAFYFEYSEGKKKINLKAAIGFGKTDLEKLQLEWVFDLGEKRGLVGMVGQTREPLTINDGFTDLLWLTEVPTIKSALFLPAVYEKQLMGVWCFLNDDPEKFDEKIVRDLETIVNNVAVVIEKNHLFEKIKQSEYRYRILVETSIDAIVTFDDDGFTTDWSRGAEEVFGYSKEERIGESTLEFVPEQYRKQMEEIVEEVRKKGYKRAWESQLFTKDGRLLDVEMTFTYLGEELGFTTIIRDITRRKQAAQFFDALNNASVVTATALTPDAIFTTMVVELAKLDINCRLFPIDDIKTGMFSICLHCDLPLNESSRSIELLRENFSLPIDAIDLFKRVVRKKESIFVEDIQKILDQIFPKFTDQVPASFKGFIREPRIIIAPLIVEETVIGVFSVQSKNLISEDAPAVTAFANQLAAAWAKAKLTAKLQQTMNGIIQTIALIVEMRDPYTAGHQNRVGDLAAAIAAEMQLSSETIEGVRIAGIIHDLGKIAVPAEILSKPGKLSVNEYNLVKMHPQVGFDMLKNIEFPWPLAQIVFQHHERMNGSGYPQGLKAKQILLEARIIAVADVVEAMSSHRPYRPSLGYAIAKDEIFKNKGTLYDAEVVDACLHAFETGYKLPEVISNRP
jgi:PAS domain S-box-containing protein